MSELINKEKKLLLIVNPCAGKAKMRTELLKVASILSEGGYELTVYPTKHSGDATDRVSRVKTGEYDLIVACGGDGTLNEVITGLQLSDADCPLGYIPAGTLNEWSAGLNISKNIKTAALDILNGQEITLDIGAFDDKYFSYTASFGAFTEASYSAPQDLKNIFGQTAYIFEGIKSLGNIKPYSMKISCNNAEIEGDFLFGAISNSMSVGGIVKFDENTVKLNDGLFEVLLIRKPDHILELQSIIDGLLRHDLKRDGMEFFHASELTIHTNEELSWTLDGEFAAGKSELKIKNLHSAIRLIVPKSK